NAAYWLMRSEARRQLAAQHPDCDWKSVEKNEEYLSLVVGAQAHVCIRAMTGPDSISEGYAWRMVTFENTDRDQMDAKFLANAIEIAIENARSGRGGPFGAIVVKDGGIIGSGANRVVATNDPTAHAEMIAMRHACKALESHQLAGCDLYTSCEPCPMCMGAIYWARPSRVIFAASRNEARQAGFDDAFIYE